jgi:hypothetical protein
VPSCHACSGPFVEPLPLLYSALCGHFRVITFAGDWSHWLFTIPVHSRPPQCTELYRHVAGDTTDRHNQGRRFRLAENSCCTYHSYFCIARIRIVISKGDKRGEKGSSGKECLWPLGVSRWKGQEYSIKITSSALRDSLTV